MGAPHLLGPKFSDGVQQAESIHLELLGSPREARPDLNCRKIASLTMSAPSSTFWVYDSVAHKECAISLSQKVCAVPNLGPLVIVFQVRNSVRPMHLFGHNP